MNKNTQNKGPGRPRYQMKYPTTKEWTFQDLMEVNGVSLKNGKGPNCTKLTLTKNMDRDLFIRAKGRKGKKGKIIRPNPNSVAVRLADTFAEPNSKDGLGRKGFLYSLRAKLNGRPAKATKPAVATKATRKTRTPKTADVSPATKNYEEIKAILASTPTPAPVAPAPAAPVIVPAVSVTPAPEPVAAPAPAPVAETPAPAPETSNAPASVATTPVETPVVNS